MKGTALALTILGAALVGASVATTVTLLVASSGDSVQSGEQGIPSQTTGLTKTEAEAKVFVYAKTDLEQEGKPAFVLECTASEPKNGGWLVVCERRVNVDGPGVYYRTYLIDGSSRVTVVQ